MRGKWALLLLFGLVSCAHETVAVRAPVLMPARVPVRAFPSIWVAGGALEDETYLLDRLAAHLAKDARHEVRRVDVAELEPARKAGQISPSTVVVLLSLEVRSGMQSYWDTQPMQYCGYYGCSTQYQSYRATIPEVIGEAVLTVYEGPTARVLQREHFSERAAGEDSEALRDEVIELLAVALERSVDVLKIKERLELYDVDDVPDVAKAVALIRRGKWDEGRALLEVAAKHLGGYGKKTQAKVWYNLGLARWFAPGKDGLTQQAYEDAARALAWAARLDDHPVHGAALVRLSEAREGFAALEEQRRATAHNFEVSKQARETPAPDESPAPQESPALQESPAQEGKSEGAAPLPR